MGACGRPVMGHAILREPSLAVRSTWVVPGSMEPPNGAAAHERSALLSRSVTFARDVLQSPPKAPAPPGQAAVATQQHSGDAVLNLAKAAWGTKQVSNNRVSESLDYEPAQNKIFYDRMKSREKKKKSIFG